MTKIVVIAGVLIDTVICNGKLGNGDPRKETIWFSSTKSLNPPVIICSCSPNRNENSNYSILNLSFFMYIQWGLPDVLLVNHLRRHPFVCFDGGKSRTAWYKTNNCQLLLCCQ